MTIKNRHGLKRTIPSDIKRKIRQECGFGCVVCGNSIYQYEHIIPEFNDAETHDIDKIGLLCGSCHDQVTRGLLPKQYIQEKRQNPVCLDTQKSSFEYFINTKDDIIIELGKIKFINTPNILMIDSQNILSILSPETDNSPPLISATFYDRNEKKVAWINNNEWYGNSDSFDIESVGSTIKIRSDLHKIDLQIKLIHPNTIQINKLDLYYKGNSITGNEKKGFLVKSKQAQIELGKEEIVYEKVPFGISIQGEKIFVGSSNVIDFTNLKGERTKLSGHYEIDGGELKLEYGESNSPKIHYKSDGTGNGLGIKFHLPETENEKIYLNFKKQGRNNSCRCGSKKKYKNCCEKKELQLNEIVNISSVFRIAQNLFEKYKVANIYYEFHSMPDKNNTWLHWHNDYPIVKINSSKSFDKSNIAYTLLCWELKKEGFKYIFGTYSDGREGILNSLQDLLLSIPILERLKLDDFDISRFHEKEISVIKTIMVDKVQNPNDKTISGDSLIESTKIIRLEYNTSFLPQKERDIIKELFRTKSPVAFEVCKQIFNIISSSNIYTTKGFNDCLFNCVTLFNKLTSGKFSKFIERIKE